MPYYVTYIHAYIHSGDERDDNGNKEDKMHNLFVIFRSSLSAGDREFQANLRNIQDMFPDLSRDLLEKALIQTKGDVEAAIDHVIAQKNELVQGLSKLVIYNRVFVTKI